MFYNSLKVLIMKKKKSYIINTIFILLVTGLTLYYLIHSKMIKNLSVLKNLTFLDFIAIISTIVVFVLADSFIIYSSAKMITNKAKFSHGIGAYFVGNLGSNVTPWKSGHLPFAYFYYRRRKYTNEETFAIIINNHLVYSTCLVFLYGAFGIISAINHFSVLIGETKINLWFIGAIGSVFNLGYLVVCFLMTRNIHVQNLIIKVEAFFLKKLKKIDDCDKFKVEKQAKMVIYKECIDRYIHKPQLYILPVFSYVVFMLACYGLPYIIYIALSNDTVTLKNFCYFFTLYQATSYVSNILPIPGGTAVAEFSFITVFKKAMGDSYCSTAMLIWRILTYFLFIIVDFVYFLIFTSKTEIEKEKNLKLEEQ